MKVMLRNILFISLLGLLVTCEEDEITSRNYPRLNTLAVSEISSEGAKFNAEIIFRGDFEVLNYGFVWSELNNPTIEDNDRVIYSENIQSEIFSERIETTLKEGESYYVRAFVETDEFIVYGENVSFLSSGSNGPELIDFSPKSGHFEDTIKISGSNFGRIESNVEVKINQIDVEIVDFKETELLVLVPDALSVEFATISVSVSGNSTSFDEEFRLLKPIISNLSPTDVTYGTVVVIEGENFNTRPNAVLVEFTGTNRIRFPAEITSITTTRIAARVPLNVDSKQTKIVITMNDFENAWDQIMTFRDPIIASFSPKSGNTTSEITIVGQNFSPIAANNTVRIDGYPAEVISAENDKLIAIIPDQSDHIYSSRESQVAVEILATETLAEEQFNITDKWFRLDDLPFGAFSWKGLAVNSEGYVLLQGGLWKYNSTTDQWISLTAFPDDSRNDPGIFSIADKIYLGTGRNSINRNNKDFWEYDIPSDSWIQKNDFPGEARNEPLAFSIGSNGYMGVGFQDIGSSCCAGFNDVWQYDPNLDTWKNVPDYPLSTAEFRGYWRMVSTSLNNEVYVGLGTSAVQGTTNNEVYKYVESSEDWERIEDYPVHAQFGHSGGIAFTVDNQAFFGSGSNTDVLWSYDGSRWIPQESNSSVGRNGGFSFVIDNIAYLGGGQIGNQFWLFDTSQPD